MFRRIVYIKCFCLLVLGSSFGQGTNPFEVRKDSLNSIEVNSKPINDTVPSENIFEIRQDSIIQTPVTDINPDTSDAVIESNKTFNKNPFEVSHIPLRKARKTSSNLNKATGQKSNGPKSNGQFLFWVLLFTSIVFAIVFSQNYSNVVKIARSILNDNMLRQSMNQEKSGTSLLFLVLYFLFAINISIVLYKYVNTNTDFSGFINWFILLGSILGLYLGRHLCYRLIGFIFPVSKEIGQYSYTTGLFNVFLGLILLPMNLFIVFAPDKLSVSLMYISLIMIGFFYLFRLFRGGFIFSRLMNSNIFHIFIYICTCEIAPMLIIYRMLV